MELPPSFNKGIRSQIEMMPEDFSQSFPIVLM